MGESELNLRISAIWRIESARRAPSPVVQLNRAGAASRAFDPEAGHSRAGRVNRPIASAIRFVTSSSTGK